MNEGKRFEQKFRESVKQCGFILRIPDKLTMRGGHLISEQTEADFVAVVGDETYLIECKATNRPRLEFYNVKEHQEQSLHEFDHAGKHSHGILAVEFYDKKRYGFANAMFLMPIEVWLAFKEETNRKSMPLKVFEERGVLCPYEKGKYQLDFGAWSA